MNLTAVSKVCVAALFSLAVETCRGVYTARVVELYTCVHTVAVQCRLYAVLI